MGAGTFRIALKPGERATVDRLKDALGLDKDAPFFRFLLRMADRLERKVYGSADAIFCEKTPDGIPVHLYRAAQERRAQMAAIAPLCEFGQADPTDIGQAARIAWAQLVEDERRHKEQYG